LAQSININAFFNDDGPTGLQGLLEVHVDAGSASRVGFATVPAAIISAWVKSRWKRGRWHCRARRRRGATEHWTPAAQRTGWQLKTKRRTARMLAIPSSSAAGGSLLFTLGAHSLALAGLFFSLI